MPSVTVVFTAATRLDVAVSAAPATAAAITAVRATTTSAAGTPSAAGFVGSVTAVRATTSTAAGTPFVSGSPAEPPPVPPLSATSVSWRSLTFGGTETPYKLVSIAGWDELPAFDTDTVPLAGWHGTKVAPIRFAPRTVTLAGFTFDRAARDALQTTLRTQSAPLQDQLVTEPLTVNEAGLTLTGDARIVRVAIDKEGWSLGRFGWAAQWLCSDPLRYGPQTTTTAVIASPVAGVVYPVTYPVTYPANPPSGSVTVNNSGTAAAPAVYRLVGPLTQPGVANVDTGKRVEYDLNLGPGDELVIDTAQQASFLNGEYRTQTAASDLTSDLEIPAGISTLQALGNPGTVTSTAGLIEDPAGSGLYLTTGLTEDPTYPGLYPPTGLTEDPTHPGLYLFTEFGSGATPSISVTFRPAYW